MINLEKKIEKGSFRYLGQEHDGLTPQKLVIAGNNIIDIAKANNLTSYKIGRYNTKNVFMLFDRESIFYVYVNPNYRNYRNAFKKIINLIPKDFHVDHILSRNLAKHFKFNYVLLCVIPKKVNMKHGSIEKIKGSLYSIIDFPQVCYSDDRIFDKILSRNPLARKQFIEIRDGYNSKSKPNYGLTLKQKGIWNRAFGFDRLDKTILANIKQIG
jgi:hypothetical protein